MDHLNWIKPNKEFKIGVKYFDVVWKKKLKNGSFSVQCVDDRQETKLFIHLTDFTNKNLNQQNKQSSLGLVFELVKTPYLIHQQSRILAILEFNALISSNFLYSKKINSGFYAIENPPPIFC